MGGRATWPSDEERDDDAHAARLVVENAVAGENVPVSCAAGEVEDEC